MSFNRVFQTCLWACFLLGSAACFSSETFAGSSTLDARTDGEIDRMEQAGRYQDLGNYIERRLGEGVEPGATPLAYLCLAYGKLKRYSKLLDCLARLERRIDAGDWQIQPMNNLRYNAPGDARPLLGAMRAEALVEFGDYRKAITTGEGAYSAIPKSSFSYSPPFPPVKLKLMVLPVLVIAATQAGEKEQAKRFMVQLENVEMPFGGSGMWETLKSNGLGRAYMALGMYGKAIDELAAFRRSTLTGGLADLLRGWSANGDSFVTIYELPRRLMLGKAYLETGKLGEAKATLDEVLASPRARDVGDLYWLTLFERGRIAEAEKDPQAAAKLYETALHVIEEQRATINTETSKIGFVGDKQAVYGRMIELLLEQGRAVDAFDYVERSKSRALVDMLASKKDFAAHAVDPGKAKFILDQLDLASEASRAQDGSSSAGETNSARNLTAARQEIKSVAPELSSLVTVSSVSSEELRGLIGEHEALVEYYYRGRDLYAFVLDRRQLRAVKLEGEGLEDQVRAFRHGLEASTGDAWRKHAVALYDRLWKPLEAALGTPQSVIVVSHGVLHYLPFAALTRADGGFLIDRHRLRFLPSASVLKFLKPKQSNRLLQMLVLGNPDLGDPSLDLQFAESEARVIAGMFLGSRLLVRKDASETNLKTAGTAFNRIHFATHGKFQADDPLASGLYLAKDGSNDGTLTVGELYSMGLDTDLVTLSACETGLGKVANGDDVVGLTRGFLYAGSRSIVASLWSVDDNATAELMKRFYANLAGMNKEEALRQAVIGARQSFAHPYFWAAFQLTGNGD